MKSNPIIIKELISNLFINSNELYVWFIIFYGIIPNIVSNEMHRKPAKMMTVFRHYSVPLWFSLPEQCLHDYSLDI